MLSGCTNGSSPTGILGLVGRCLHARRQYLFAEPERRGSRIAVTTSRNWSALIAGTFSSIQRCMNRGGSSTPGCSQRPRQTPRSVSSEDGRDGTRTRDLRRDRLVPRIRRSATIDAQSLYSCGLAASVVLICARLRRLAFGRLLPFCCARTVYYWTAESPTTAVVDCALSACDMADTAKRDACDYASLRLRSNP
jgi:hypothetical protein